MNQRELYIFPTQNKKPIAKYAPNGFQSAKLESEWSGNESDQWAAPCGEINGFFVIDVDAKKGGIETGSHIPWGDTQIVNTPGGGYHVFYEATKESEALFRNIVDVLPGIDIRTTGGYVCLYDTLNFEAIKRIPPEVVSILSAEIKKPKEKAPSLNGEAEIAEGGRNAYLTKAAGRMQRLGVLTLQALQEINEKNCVPPLDEAEVEAIHRSVSRYDPESTPEEDETPPKKILWAGEMVSEMFEFLRDKGKTLGESTGIDGLDKLLGGGKRLGELTVTMAEAKTGKNTFWHFQQRGILDRGLAIGYASRELSPETEVLPNLLTLKLNKNIYKEDVTEEEVMQAIQGWKLAFAPGYGSFQRNELFEWMDECLLHGIRYFWIDHLHYCLVDAEDFKLVSEFGRKLKTYAKTHMVHIDLIIQPKNVPFIKQGDKLVPQELDIGLLRGGANLGQVLDSLITMQRVRNDDNELTNTVKIELKRARSKLARPGKIFMRYDFNTMTFTECEDPTGDDQPKIKQERKSPFAKTAPEGYYQSKGGEFFNLKKSIGTMMTTIKGDEK